MADQKDDIRLSIAHAFSTPVKLDFVLPGLLAESTGLIIAPGGTGKSMLALQLGMTVALGSDPFDFLESAAPENCPDMTPGPVVYLNVEDGRDLIHSRLHSIGKFIDSEDDKRILDERMHVIPAVGKMFSIAEKVEGGAIVASETFKKWTERVAQVKPRLVILDTLNRLSAGLDENSNGDMGRLMSIIDAFNRQVGCATLIVHHASKASMWAGQGDVQQAGRGASAVTDNARWQANMMAMTKEQATEFKLEEEQRKQWVKVEHSKVNAGPPMPAWFAHRSMGGVLTGRPVPPWEMPDHQPKRNGKARRGGQDPY